MFRVLARAWVYVLAVAWILGGGGVVWAAPFFMGVGSLPGESFGSVPWGMSGDGSIVVGSSGGASGQEAFRWTQAGGMISLGGLPGGFIYTEARDVSANGQVVVGIATASVPGGEAFRWTQAGGMVSLGYLPGGDEAAARGVSDDGSVVVGYSDSIATGFELEAFRWTQGGGMVGLGDLPGGIPWSEARGISADGSVIVGWSQSGSGNEAFRWTQAGGMVGLGDLAGGFFAGYATAASADGSVIVGASSSAASGFSPSRSEAFRWTQADGMVGLGDLPSGAFHSIAYDVSADGSVVVGTSSTSAGPEAFIWDSTNGMRDLWLVLFADYGLTDVLGWRLAEAQAVSADGLVIVGTGRNPDGRTEGWIANLRTQEIPEPSSVVPLGMGAAALVGYHWRRRRGV